MIVQLSFRDRPIVFVDVEASGLDPGSFPVELGWSADDEREPASLLIHPGDEWPKTDAYEAGQAIHSISYADLLAQGVHLHDVPKRLEGTWTGAILVSDAVPQDTAWIARAYAALDMPMPWKLIGFDVVVGALVQWSGLGMAEAAGVVVAAKRRMSVPHRAGPDAQRLHRIARAVVDPAWRAVLTDPVAVAAGAPLDVGSPSPGRAPDGDPAVNG